MKLVCLFLISLSMGLCKGQCGPNVTQSQANMFSNIFDAIDLYNNCDFSAEKFNASCVSASCPQLLASGLCPSSNGSQNISALNTILSILNDCFRQQTTICDTPLNNLIIPQVGIGLSQVFAGLPVGGSCSKVPNIGLVSNVQNVTFAITPGQSSTSGPLNVTINAPEVTLTAAIACSITLLFFSLPISLPNISVSLAIQLTPTASINFQDDQPEVQVQANNFTMSFNVGKFAPLTNILNSIALLLPQLQSLFTSGVTDLWKTSGNPTAIATFYSTFMAYGIEATKSNCKSLP